MKVDITNVQSSPLRSAIFNKRMLICVFTGFSSGLPLFVVLQLLQAWMRKEGVSLTDIGLFALLTLPYNLKFLWAPFLDSYSLPFLGLRRGWMLFTQLILLILIASFGLFSPQQSIITIGVIALATSIFSATQDVVLDAYRRELLPDRELGLGNSIHVQAYRISGLVPGSLGLILADHFSWSIVFIVVAMFMLLGIVMTLCVRELAIERPPVRGFNDIVMKPFQEIDQRLGRVGLLQVLLFMILYKLGDTMATALSTAFYIDLGFSLKDIGVIAKNAALWPSIIGGILGGILMIRIGINKALWVFGVFQWITILGFVFLSTVGADKLWLAVVIACEYLGVGLGTAAFTAFIARTTSPVYAASQFALLTALATLPRTLTSSVSGAIADSLGWYTFFWLCVLLALPGMLMLLRVAPWGATEKVSE